MYRSPQYAILICPVILLGMFEEIYKLTPPCEGKRSLKADAMLSMLSSWYISGYYTGFYHGLEAKK
ncbi:hypothetical protein HZS_3721 [Henneguya salminicola]|nr:hypothetical protein HZS_3721 [Henneguya salminicola]